jgi:hypothetical protein
MAVTPNQVADELRDLIAALDRRVPRVEQAGEASIARDAAALREKAVQRLEQLSDRSTIAALGAGDRSTQSPDAPPMAD